ncbi:MAG: sugar phosphate isomerase/epimerase [Kiritimatiellae bacterium]|nr:sugar phosphate isomerase/epimerase [Kiritimatiellia bacterium]
MKSSICHYSLHRVFKDQNWSLQQLVDFVKGQGVDGIDFHVKFLPAPDEAADAIQAALAGSGLVLSGLSLSTNFNQDDPSLFREQIDTAQQWLEVAGAVKAPASRVFGGHLKNRKDAAALKTGMARVKEALRELAPAAEQNGVVLALENHGGLPCSGEEQVEVIEAIDSPFLRATIDVGNYMAMPQDPVDGTKAAAKYCAYVHLKDGRLLADGKVERSVIGEGEVDIPECLRTLKASGYDGFVALEYEAAEDELSGVPKSVTYMKKVMAEL